MVVAVLDDGFELSHPDIRWYKNQGEIPENGIDDDQNGYVDDVNGWNVDDENGRIPAFSHGTLVSGVVGGITNNDLGVSGVGLGTQVMPVAGIFNLESEVVAGYDYILRMRRLYDASGGQKGAFVVATNASFGKDREDPADFPLWCGVFDELGLAGILSVVATANDNYNVDQQGDVPSACTSPWMIAVTSTDRTDVKVDRAAYGLLSVDLGAPGSQIFSTDLGNSYGLASGTSYAAPMVAGAIPMIMGRAGTGWMNRYNQDPAEGALALRDIIMQTVDTLTSLQGRVTSGVG